MSYSFLQEYWWFVISLLGALLVFLLFVQGGQSFIFTLGKDNMNKRLLVNSTGRKWEFTFTTLVVFGGAFFASFPLFYSTSFSGAYWVWALILFCFIVQAVSYVYMNDKANVWGSKTYQVFLFANGLLAPILIGAAVSTFFFGANFSVNKDAITDLNATSITISSWLPYNGVQLHGLEAVFNIWNVVFGLALFFLSRTTALLFFINNIDDDKFDKGARARLTWNSAIFVILFLAWLSAVLTKRGFAYDPTNGQVFLEPYKYFNNLMEMPFVLGTLIIGVVLVLFGIVYTILKPKFKKGIWVEGIGVVLTALSILLIAGWNNTCYYPSALDPAHLQDSLTIRNSSSSDFTLRVMFYVSFLVPFVVGYIWYTWRALDLHKLTRKEVEEGLNDHNAHIY